MKISIGDVVNVIDYGCRVANQLEVVRLFKDIDVNKLNLNNKFVSTDFHTCNKVYTNIEWKVIASSTVDAAYVLLLLRTRNFEDACFIYEPFRASHFNLVRKNKKSQL